MRKFPRIVLAVVTGLVTLAGAITLWMRSEGSLAQALRLGQAWLPAGMQLSYQNASGSLVKGQVEHWRWQQAGLAIEGQQLHWAVNTAALWQGRLEISELSLQTLTLNDTRPSTPQQPWSDLQLPLPVDAQIRIDQLFSTGRIPWSAQQLRAHYTYNRQAHHLALEQLAWAQGHYRGQLQLQAQAPMALQAQLDAELAAPNNTPLLLQAQAQGQLTGLQASIHLQARLHTEVEHANAPQFTLDAQLHPWLGLSSQHAQARWQALSPSLLWPQAPHVLLNGSLNMQANDTGQTGEAAWHLQLDTQVGQGHLGAQATQTGQQWQGDVVLSALRSTDLYPAAPDTLWSGRTQFNTTAQGLGFSADLHGQERGGAPAHVRGQGRWTASTLQLNLLDVRWAGLLAQGQMQTHSNPRRIQGQLQLQWPGMHGQWQGDLQAEQGQARLQLAMTDAAQNAQWLAQWPALPALPWSALHSVQTDVQWAHGWNHPQAAVQAQWSHKGWRAQTQLSAQSDLSAQQIQTRLVLEQLRLTSPEQKQWSAQLAQPLVLLQQRAHAQWQTRWMANDVLVQGPAGHTAHLTLDEGQWGAARHQLLLSARDWPLAWAQTVLGTDGLGGVNVNTHAELSVQEQNIRAQLQWDSPVAGSLHAQLQTQATVHGGQWQWSSQSPLQGEVQTDLPELGAWSRLAPPGWRVRGHLSSRITVSGSLAQPQWQGHAKGENMAIRSAVDGVEFHDGHFNAQLHDQQIVLQDFAISGAGEHGGTLRGQGQIVWPAGDDRTPWNAADALVQLKLVAEQLRVTNRADRRLVISGEIDTRVAQRQLQLRGRVRADQALFLLAEDSTPTLGRDVHVRGRSQDASVSESPTGQWLHTPDVQVALDLGDDFYVMGQGLTTRLTGQLKISSNAQTQGKPRLQGQLKTVGGLYKAYGQNLAIEQGALTFSGAYDNPQLDIVALRANISERVGVRVSGTALNPAVRLYADPDMPDADKLAWLVLGRSAANGGAESVVLQQAALSLLGGKKPLGSEVAQALGLDEVSLAQGSRSNTSATGAALTLGKRLSKDFYMAYESSLSGTFGSLFVFYDLSRRWTLRAQAGDQNTLDLIYTIRKQ